MTSEDISLYVQIGYGMCSIKRETQINCFAITTSHYSGQTFGKYKKMQ